MSMLFITPFSPSRTILARDPTFISAGRPQTFARAVIRGANVKFLSIPSKRAGRSLPFSLSEHKTSSDVYLRGRSRIRQSISEHNHGK